MTTILNKKILLSLGMIAFVAVAAIGATGAFFSDTETSTGNTFTAGAIDLGVDNTSYYNGAPNLEATWQVDWNMSDGTPHQFFNFSDLKPGDWGEDTISLHVNNNDSYLCADVTLKSDNDNTPTEPELTDDNDTGVGQGELADNVNFYWWADDGDNVFETNETLLPAGPLGSLNVDQTATVTLADSQTNIWGYTDNVTGGGAPLPGNTVKYIGKAWCFGESTFTPYPATDGSGPINTSPIVRPVVCSGANENNITQTDSMTADISFRAVQSRNNNGFLCSATQPNGHSLRLENETEVTGGPWIVHSGDQIYADLTWTGDGPTFNYTLNGQGLAPSTSYSLIYYADGWPGNNPGAYIGTHVTDGTGAIVAQGGNPNLGVDLPTLSDSNFATGAKIWLVRSADYNSGTAATGPMTSWNPSQYLFDGNVYIHYNDTNN